MSDKPPIEQEMDIQARNLQLAWAAFLDHEAGRLVLWSILDLAGIGRLGAGMFPHFGTDQDALLKGRQQVGAEILDNFVYDCAPDAYITMLQEAETRADALRIAAERTENEENEG